MFEYRRQYDTRDTQRIHSCICCVLRSCNPETTNNFGNFPPQTHSKALLLPIDTLIMASKTTMDTQTKHTRPFSPSPAQHLQSTLKKARKTGEISAPTPLQPTQRYNPSRLDLATLTQASQHSTQQRCKQRRAPPHQHTSPMDQTCQLPRCRPGPSISETPHPC